MFSSIRVTDHVSIWSKASSSSRGRRSTDESSRLLLNSQTDGGEIRRGHGIARELNQPRSSLMITVRHWSDEEITAEHDVEADRVRSLCRARSVGRACAVSHPETMVIRVDHGGHSNQDGVPLVHHLQLHVRLETVRRFLRRETRETCSGRCFNMTPLRARVSLRSC